MGKLHNRRRTRLRPNKKAQHQAIAILPPSTSLMPTQAIVNNYDMSSFHQQLGIQGFNRDKTSKHLNEQHEVRHTQYFGAGEGDESGDLCPLMLQVVLDLFDGVDYEDP